MNIHQSIKTTLFFTIAFLALSGFSVQAQEKLTLKEAINYALENKADAKKARLATQNAENQIAEVRSQALPQVSLSGNLIYNPILQESALPGEFFGQPPGSIVLVPFGQEWMAVGGVSVVQNIFNYSVFTGLKAAKSTREFYQINQQLTEEEVIEAVANSYYHVFIAKQKLETVETTLENTLKVQNTMLGLFENGLARKIDLDRIKVSVVNLNSSKQQLINQVQLQENMLKFLIGMPIDTPIVIEEDIVEVTPVLLDSPDVKQLSSYQLLFKQKELLEYNKRAIVAGYYPTLSLAGNYNYQGIGNTLPLSNAKPADGVFWTDYASVNLNLSIPVFTGFGTRSKVRQAQFELDTIEEDLKDTELALSYSFENTKAQINNSMITISNQEENVKLAEEVFENTQNNYINGLATLTDLIDAENALTEAKNNYSNALLEYKLAEIQLIKSQGKLQSLIN